MMRSFIQQLSPSPPLTSMLKVWETHKMARSDPSLDELSDVLHEIIRITRKVFLVIDALDECPQTSDRSERETLLKYINVYLNRHKNNVHILVTSRMEHDIKSTMRLYKSINIEKWVGGDVRIFVKKKINSGSLAKYHRKLKIKIEESLLSTEEQ